MIECIGLNQEIDYS